MRFRVVLIAVILLFVSTPLIAQAPPLSSGPFVVRGEFDGGDFDWWYGYADGKRGTVAIHGVDLISWCMGDPTGYNVWDFQDNFPPADEGLVHELLKADDVTTSVWPISILFVVDLCIPVLEMGEPLAEGTVDMIVNDNDVWAWIYYHERANAFMLSAHGLVYAPDGEQMVFNGGYNCVWKPSGDRPVKCKNKIVIN